MIKKNLVQKTFVLTVLTIFVGSCIMPSTVGIIKNTNIEYNLKSGSYIQELIDNASAGDTIYVPSGIYYENIVIDISISLIGEDKNTTIIDGGGSGDVIHISADYVNINNFTIQNSGQEFTNGGIRISSNLSTITGNKISNNNYGIRLFNFNYTTIKDNIIKDNIIWNNNKSGIRIYGYGHDNNISSNNISNNENSGITIYGNDNTINSNNISNNGQTGIYLAYSSSTISDNIISNNDEYGIQFYRANYNTIEGNNILNNSVGLYISGSDFNIITSNSISSNFRGIEIRDMIVGPWGKYDASKRNKCFKNNIISNNENAYFVYFSIFRGNTWRYNYWDRPRLLPKFILGEMGSNTWFEIDWRPALKPYDIGVGI